jgi:hypothetical protein
LALSRGCFLIAGFTAILLLPVRARGAGDSASGSQVGDSQPHLKKATERTDSPTELDAVAQVPVVAVLDRPDASGFIVGLLHKGDRVRVRMNRAAGLSWLAVAPPPTAIVWIEQSRLDLDEVDPGEVAPCTAWVRSPLAVIRSGNPGANLPGPPRGKLLPGTRVQLVDHPASLLGGDGHRSRWLAIVPPPELAFYVPTESVRCLLRTSAKTPVGEIRASYEEPVQNSENRVHGSARAPAWPADVLAEVDRVDGLCRVILRSQAVEQWHFETIRAGYQSILKRAADRPDIEEALRTRLARVTQHEQAARAARSIETILAKSHRRDQALTLLRRERAQREQARTRSYDAVGFIQPSARRMDGHKLFALIGGEGATIAYLDVPPGLDPEPYLARRVGVRGQARFNEDLGSRLISVRDLEGIESRQ